MKILITGAVGPYNKGDLGILLSTLNLLRKTNAKFTVLSYYSDALVQYFSKNPQKSLSLKVYPMLLEALHSRVIWNVKDLMMILLWASLRKYGLKMKIELFVRDPRATEVVKQYLTADVIINCGGERLRESRKIQVRTFQFFKVLHGFLLAKFLGKPIILYAQSIGPFYSLSFKMLVRFVLDKVDLIILRDKRSKENLAKIGVSKPKMHVAAWPGLLLPVISPKQAKRILLKEGITRDDSKQMLIGISTRYWRFPRSSNPLEKFESYKTVVANLADYLIDIYGCKVCFISTTEYPRPFAVFDDYHVASQIIELMKNKKKAKAISTLNYTPSEAKGIIGQMDLFIGTRMHTLIFAAPMNIPLVAISYSFKHIEFMKELGQKDRVCRIDKIDLNILKNMVDDTLKNRTQIKKILKTRVKSLQDRAIQSANLVSNFINHLC